jgi:hypothetical protein
MGTCTKYSIQTFETCQNIFMEQVAQNDLKVKVLMKKKKNFGENEKDFVFIFELC